jgi:hypothetical protein
MTRNHAIHPPHSSSDYSGFGMLSGAVCRRQTGAEVSQPAADEKAVRGDVAASDPASLMGRSWRGSPFAVLRGRATINVLVCSLFRCGRNWFSGNVDLASAKIGPL